MNGMSSISEEGTYEFMGAENPIVELRGFDVLMGGNESKFGLSMIPSVENSFGCFPIECCTERVEYTVDFCRRSR